MKKRVVVSIENLSEELNEELKARYPLGLNDHMVRIDKPNGDFFYGVMLEMTDVTYLVKVNVKIDQNPNEEIEKELFKEETEENAVASELEIADESSEE